MKDHLISLYIDDELGLDAKIDFVETVHADAVFKNETVDLLTQEKWIRSDVTDHCPSPSLSVFSNRRSLSDWFRSLVRPVGIFTSGLATALLVLFLSPPQQGPQPVPYRFVIYQPDTARAEITGSFTGWQAVPMKRTGTGGYWEITLDLPEGIHRFSYILDRNRRTADPTIPTRELDDFGGENSIFEVKTRI